VGGVETSTSSPQPTYATTSPRGEAAGSSTSVSSHAGANCCASPPPAGRTSRRPKLPTWATEKNVSAVKIRPSGASDGFVSNVEQPLHGDRA
jgi:hypothetical protein